jgi:hypothetical protein
LLAAGDSQGLLEAGFRLGYIWGGLAQQQLALEPIRFCEQVTPPTFLHHRQGLAQQAQPGQPQYGDGPAVRAGSR